MPTNGRYAATTADCTPGLGEQPVCGVARHREREGTASSAVMSLREEQGRVPQGPSSTKPPGRCALFEQLSRGSVL